MGSPSLLACFGCFPLAAAPGGVGGSWAIIGRHQGQAAMKKPRIHMSDHTPHQALHLVHKPQLDMSHIDTQEATKEHEQLGNKTEGFGWNIGMVGGRTIFSSTVCRT